MKIADFCNFFEFTFEAGEFYDDGEKYKYIATDNQGVFRDRLFNDIEFFIDAFDSMVPDYVDDDLEYNGFEYDKEDPAPYYVQAYKWMSDNPDYKDTDVYEIVKLFSGNDTLTL